MRIWRERKGVWESCWSTSSLTAFSNLRFADDVPLFFTTLKQQKKMMSDFKRNAEAQSEPVVHHLPGADELTSRS